MSCGMLAMIVFASRLVGQESPLIRVLESTLDVLPNLAAQIALPSLASP